VNFHRVGPESGSDAIAVFVPHGNGNDLDGFVKLETATTFAGRFAPFGLGIGSAASVIRSQKGRGGGRVFLILGRVVF